MKLIPLDPPGSFCAKYAFLDLVNSIAPRPKSFVEVGCGQGKLSELLCRSGLHGVGIDFSEQAIKEAETNLQGFIRKGTYRLRHADIMEDSIELAADLVFSMMVMEHVDNDREFLMRLKRLTKPGGAIIVGVPSRKEKWGIEDELVGHYRRYEKDELARLFQQQRLDVKHIWSVGAPVANVLLAISNFLYQRHYRTFRKDSQQERTKASGVIKVPLKTMYPRIFKLILNDIVMSPLKYLQRLFYKSNKGLTVYILGEAKR